MQKQLNFIDLFSGCGGFSCGFELAGHKCLLGVDNNADAIETFSNNHHHAETYCGDIQKLDSQKLKALLKGKKIDVIIGGPPCQGFSTIGKGQADDVRNMLFLEYLRIVKELKPKAIVIENVVGLLAAKNSKTLTNIFDVFEDLGYKMDARVLSADEYGVPEKRRRTILIGTTKGHSPIFPEVSHGARGTIQAMTVGTALSDLKSPDGDIYNHSPETALIKNELDAARLKHIPEGAGIRYKRDEEEHLPKKLRYNIDWDELAENRFRQTRLQRLSRSKPSFTILTSRTSYYHPTENRYLTAREAAAIQSFPNDFIFSGSLTSQFRQIGNAVPPILGKVIAKAVEKSLSKKVKASHISKHDFAHKAFSYKSDVVATEDQATRSYNSSRV